MLLFELFPMFISVVCLVIGVKLALEHRRTSHEPPQEVPDSLQPPGAANVSPDARPGRGRPSMSA